MRISSAAEPGGEKQVYMIMSTSTLPWLGLKSKTDRLSVSVSVTQGFSQGISFKPIIFIYGELP